MNTMQTFLNDPAVGFFTIRLMGLLGGWIAEKGTAPNHGILTNLLVGIAGSFVGAKLAEVLQIPVFGFWRNLGAAAVGAIILLWVWRAIQRR